MILLEEGGVLLPSKGQGNAGGDFFSSPYSLSLKENECPTDGRELGGVTFSPSKCIVNALQR